MHRIDVHAIELFLLSLRLQYRLTSRMQQRFVRENSTSHHRQARDVVTLFPVQNTPTVQAVCVFTDDLSETLGDSMNAEAPAFRCQF